MAPNTPQTRNWRVARVRSFFACQIIRQSQFAFCSILMLFFASPTLNGQTNEPALEPIPLPTPLAKADKVGSEEQRQTEELRSVEPIPADAPSEPALQLRPASNLEPRPVEGPAFSDNFSADEVIVDSSVSEPQPMAGDESRTSDRPFVLDTGHGVVEERSAYTPPQIVNPTEEIVVPAEPREYRTVPAEPHVVGPSGTVVTRATTVRSYYVTPSGRVYLPQQSTSTYQRTYYAPPVEIPAGAQVTVYRSPFSRFTAVNITPAAPTMPPGYYGYGPGPVAPVGFSLVVAGPPAPIGPPPPMVPGQPVRNAIRAFAW